MKFILLASLLVTANVGAADLFDYTVYTKTGIFAECSDFLGKTGSNGPIRLRDFLIRSDLSSQACALETSHDIAMVRGAVQKGYAFSCVRAKKFKAEDTGFGDVKRYKVDFDELDSQLDQLSGRLTELESKLTLQVVNHTYGNIELQKITRGDLLVVKVLGKDIKFRNLGIGLNETVRPSNIVWHFPEAESITIFYSGAKNVGLPGTVVAPKAKLVMNNSLITGAVYVREFEGKANSQSCNDKVSGQVNPTCLRTQEIGLGCTDSFPGGKG